MSEPTTSKFPPFGLLHDAWGQLVLIDAEGKRHEGVVPIRGFPISDPEHWVSICDSAGRELVCIDKLSNLAPQVRSVLDEDLARREFVPVIRRILKTTGDTEPCEWDVETDRGPTRFVLNSEDDVRRLGPYSGMIIDSHGIRYLISDMRTLDAASRRIVETYL
jgi:hypothetical protein